MAAMSGAVLARFLRSIQSENYQFGEYPGKGNRMKRLLPLLIITAIVTLFMACEKTEKITETEYVYDTKYVESPPDTVFRLDTLFSVDTVMIYDTVNNSGTTPAVDTVIQIDTVYNNSSDTVVITSTVYDTTLIHDTVTVINTVYQTDTVIQEVNSPYVQFAFSALQYHADSEVLAFINSEFGYTEGWVYYLSIAMSDIQSPSTGVYDIYGYIDYWSPDFSGYYPLEYYWRISLTGGDPADPDDWQLSDPPSAPKKNPGVRIAPDASIRSISK